uniref:Coiled-coil domain containing 63 n=1 Tax=Taeniopygia guttata TaxID=59729 RepID=H0Z7S0_TAEGU|nr:coiled-coil domain-containing protein 63 isoform X1 [Taeniopygia guttata]XP_041575351.1 coiled-coil domain-containing protein 63 isoform X1 [Taeniopygia guttata]XP_041575352.1 coiled-coil domain-containing protein 63 isoform X1 [Taeniopygia guttata]XP_041575353.1 coiled-coil domain-containing protein 63 isoform X1 [Taeniopygia guttata]XP_041575354.1 coiled-coil domain-containing protein 63 isoform X1 [Taeniopygia guttata]
MKRRKASADLELPEDERERRAKVEIRQLQTHFHHESYKRKFFDDDIWRQMQAQEKAIDDLKQEHRHVTLMLSQMYSPSSVILENRNRMKVQSLLQTRMQNDALIKERKAQLADLAKQVVELEKKTVKQRDTTWRMLEAKSQKHLQKKIELLEIRLSHVTVRYNTTMTRNSKLREETASLQIQKAIYDNNYCKLEKSLVQQNKLLNAAIEQATEDYEQWMEDLGRISDIRDVRYRETIQYNIRLLERKCALHRETRLKNFFLSKCADFSALKEQAKEREAFEAAERAKRSQKESYEVAYKRLLELSDGDIDDFLEDFLEKDRRFFILFGYAIRLNVRNEGLRQRSREIQGDMKAIRAQQQQAGKARTHILQELEAKMTETTEEANKYEDKFRESSKLLGQIQSHIETLLKDMDCDTTTIVKPLGESLVPGFGPVENRIKELLLKQSLRRYTSIDRTQRAQAFISPLQGTSNLLWTMDRDKLCPPPPDLETTDPKTAEEALGRAQLRQLVLQRQEEELARPSSSGKRRRRFTSQSASGARSPSGTKSPSGAESPPGN